MVGALTPACRGAVDGVSVQMPFILLLACTDAATDDSATVVEPLALPDDPSEAGVPVGVRTVGPAEAPIEVWYPASDTVADAGSDAADFMQFVSDAFLERVGDFVFPSVDGRAVRDAPLREPEAPYPLVVFSHGFGGVRLQSLDVVTHLASRGYVVAAVDHRGRAMPDLLPCIFSPALEGCDLSGFGRDPGVDGVRETLDWLEAANAGQAADSGGAFLEGRLDPEYVGLTGHSAGGGTTASAGEEDERFDALLPMAAGAVAVRDVPQLVMGGTCDAIIPDTDVVAAAESRPGTTLVRVLGAGHLAFSDLCELRLKTLADTLLSERDDLNETIYAGLVQLASDGCPAEATPPPELACGAAYLPLETSARIVRHYATAFFDDTLRGTGPGVVGGTFDAAEVSVAR